MESIVANLTKNFQSRVATLKIDQSDGFKKSDDIMKIFLLSKFQSRVAILL